MNLTNSRCRLIAISFVLIVCLSLVTGDGVTAENVESSDMDRDSFDDPYFHDDNERRSSQILSRKRRYLTFPSGSSFQLVYDLIVGVVDYTNYLILGVTSALAWQLPSEAPSEIVETLKGKLKDGTLGTQRNDSIENIQYIDTKTKPTAQNNYPQKPAYITSFTNPSPSSYYSSSSKFYPPMHSKYYSSDPIPPSYAFSNKADANYYSVRQNPLTEWKDTRLPMVSTPTKPTSTYASLASKWSQWWNKSKPKYAKPVYKRKHRIYPVFAKRSAQPHHRQKRHGIVGPSLSKLDQIHLRYHRSSRQDLYLKIEKYLETHNKDGHQCVLKALCETGQKSNEVEPGTFVSEIMRSIFTIPESEGSVQNYMHRIYDEAHAHGGSCIEKYPLCTDSLWKADFIF